MIELPWSSWEMKKLKPSCNTCGWRGEKRDLIQRRVDLEVHDSTSCGIQCLFGSPPSHQIEYSCPHCHARLASDLKFFQPFYDQESFAE